jgi:cytochrome c biogenesis protein ResB
MSKEKKNILKMAASLKLTVVCLLIFTVLVIWGTVYQAEHGLYQAQQKFFHSWIFFLGGFIPFPGTVLVMFVLFLNLLASLFYRIGFRLKNIGNVITHIGILILLVGGGLTFYFSEESSLMLREGESSAMSASRNQYELALWEAGPGDIDVYAIDTNGFEPGEVIRFDEMNLKLTIKEYYSNCLAYSGGTASGETEPVLNSSGIQLLKIKDLEAEASDNVVGGVFTVQSISGTGAPANLLLYGKDNMPTSVRNGNRTVSFLLRRKKVSLPLNMTLMDFKVKMYPNSSIPKSYESRVTIQSDSGMAREVVISMNKPLRFRDYTFFQSSYYIAQDGTEYTILAVVKNAGRLLPYISSITIFMGMLIHFLVMLVRRRKKTPLVSAE